MEMIGDSGQAHMSYCVELSLAILQMKNKKLYNIW